MFEEVLNIGGLKSWKIVYLCVDDSVMIENMIFFEDCVVFVFKVLGLDFFLKDK